MYAFNTTLYTSTAVSVHLTNPTYINTYTINKNKNLLLLDTPTHPFCLRLSHLTSWSFTWFGTACWPSLWPDPTSSPSCAAWDPSDLPASPTGVSSPTSSTTSGRHRTLSVALLLQAVQNRIERDSGLTLRRWQKTTSLLCAGVEPETLGRCTFYCVLRMILK